MELRQFSSPILVSRDQHVTVLKKIDFNSKTDNRYDEQWLQNLLFQNPQMLPLSEIDTAYQNPLPICIELDTPAGPIDILYITPEGKLILVEVKLWRNPEARRKVIGQILDYAKELNRWDYEEFQKQVSKRSDIKGNTPFEVMKRQYPYIQEATFVDEISRSLRTGRFMLLIVGDGIREGASSIAGFLQDVGHLQFTLGMVEVGLYEKDTNEIYVQPRVLAKTAIINRTVVEIRSPEIAVVEESTGDSVEEQTGETFYNTFWKELLSELKLDDAAQKMANPGNGQNIYFSMPPSSTHVWVSAYFAGSIKQVGVYIRFANTQYGKMAYQVILEQKEIIMEELPANAVWETKGDKHSIAVKMSVDDVWDVKNRVNIKQFLTTNINIFINTFRKRLERIVEDIGMSSN